MPSARLYTSSLVFIGKFCISIFNLDNINGTQKEYLILNSFFIKLLNLLIKIFINLINISF